MSEACTHPTGDCVRAAELADEARAIIAELDRRGKALAEARAENDRLRAALEKILAGREIQVGDGTTQVIERDDIDQICAEALGK